jgi:hypothetical protein
MAEPLNCEAVRAADMIDRYAAGTLPEAEAEAFEAHYLGCSDCWGELQAALELRRTLSPSAPGETFSATKKRGQAVWIGIAAAVLLAVSVSVWRAAQESPADDVVTRGPTNELTVTATWRDDGSLSITWTPAPSATLYHVRVRGGSGVSLNRQTASLALQVTSPELGEAATLQDLTIIVEAESAAGEVVGRSRATRLPHR